MTNVQHRTKEATRHVDAVFKALEILDCLAEEAPLSIGQIIRKTGLTRSRIMRLLGTLESKGYIIENRRTKAFNLGIRAAILGKAFERSNHLEMFVRPSLKDLVDTTQESATYYVTDGVERIALLREEGQHAIRFSIHEGQHTPLHAGAAGKILLAFGPSHLLNHVLSINSLKRITPRTITDPGQLKKELDLIRKNGYALSKGENVIDAYGLAAPVFNYQKIMLGAIGIAGPLNRLDEGQIDIRIKCVVRAAALLSSRFGFQASAAPVESPGRI
jgi:DNA-binding IclR family transcriptional regulator